MTREGVPGIPIPCPWPADCTCDHTRCVAGWIDNPPNEDELETTRPCPVCRPTAAEVIASTRNQAFRSRESAYNDRQRKGALLRERKSR